MTIITGGTIIEGALRRTWTNAGVPVVNVTLLGAAGVGDILSDTTGGKLYICTATDGSTTIVWTVVGTQV